MGERLLCLADGTWFVEACSKVVQLEIVRCFRMMEWIDWITIYPFGNCRFRQTEMAEMGKLARAVSCTREQAVH